MTFDIEQFDGNWSFNPAEYIVSSVGASTLLKMNRQTWAAYNAVARYLDLPILIESYPDSRQWT